jgi:hypothetical protein
MSPVIPSRNQHADPDMRRIFHIMINPVGCLLKITVGTLIDIDEFLRIPVNQRKP